MVKSRTFIGVVWASTQRFGVMIVSFICNLVLARLLTPSDFGAIGMLLFFVSMANVFVDSGFGSALIQRQDNTSITYSTIFILNILISIILYFVLYLSASYIAFFYNTPLLTNLLRVEGLVLIGNALSIVQTSILRKQMDFRRLAIANLFGNIVGSVVAIVLAYMGFGVWSLVVRILCVAYITSIFLWRVSEWVPSIHFDFKIVKKLFSFGGHMLLSSGLSTLSTNLQTIIIGKLFHQRILGLYTQAKGLRNVVADSLQGVIGQVLFPDYASLKDDEKILQKLNRSFYIITFFTTALLTLLFIIGEPLVRFLYSDKWLDAVPYFQILCIGGVFYAIQDVNYYVIAAKGESKILSSINLIKIPLFIIVLIVSGKLWGIIGLLWCIVFNSIVSYLLYGIFATRLLRSSIITQIKYLFKSIVISLVAGGCLVILKNMVIISNLIGQISLYSIVYISVLCSISIIFKVYPIQYLKKMITNRL